MRLTSTQQPNQANNTKAETWTILDEDGEKAFSFDVFIGANVRDESKVVSAPIEQGGFMSYNLVVSPIEVNCTLAKRGSSDELSEMIQELMDYSTNTKLLSVITPETEYASMKLTRIDYSRTAESGVDMIIVDISFQEVRQFTSEYTSTRLGRKKSRGRQQTKTNTSAVKGTTKRVKGWVNRWRNK